MDCTSSESNRLGLNVQNKEQPPGISNLGHTTGLLMSSRVETASGIENECDVLLEGKE